MEFDTHKGTLTQVKVYKEEPMKLSVIHFWKIMATR